MRNLILFYSFLFIAIIAMAQSTTTTSNKLELLQARETIIVREGINVTSKTLFEIPAGELIKVVERIAFTYKIEYKGKTGYTDGGTLPFNVPSVVLHNKTHFTFTNIMTQKEIDGLTEKEAVGLEVFNFNIDNTVGLKQGLYSWDGKQWILVFDDALKTRKINGFDVFVLNLNNLVMLVNMSSEEWEQAMEQLHCETISYDRTLYSPFNNGYITEQAFSREYDLNAEGITITYQLAKQNGGNYAKLESDFVNFVMEISEYYYANGKSGEKKYLIPNKLNNKTYYIVISQTQDMLSVLMSDVSVSINRQKSRQK